MHNSKTMEALSSFKADKYDKALKLYHELANEIGYKYFYANIQLCNNRMKKQGKETEGTLLTNNINIVYIADVNFLIPTYVSIFSLIRNKSNLVSYNIYIICVGVDTKQQEIFKDLARPNVYIHVVNSKNEYEKYRILKDGFHVSPVAIQKFNLPHILNYINKVLYIDGDTIIKSDLTELYSHDINEQYAAVIEDIKPKLKYNPPMLKKLNIENHSAYFNSGVMLLNLQKMRNDRISEKLFNYRLNGINYFMDQDALNVVFNNRVKFISCKYNTLLTLCEVFSIDDIVQEYCIDVKYKSFHEMINKSDIIHYSSNQKPWINCNIENAYYWHQYFLSSRVYEKPIKLKYEVHKNDYLKGAIVSLTSYPARINNVHLTIKSLLSQTFNPQNIILWLAKEQFPNKEHDLPLELLDLTSKGLNIKWRHDIKSFKKLIFTLNEYPNDVVVTADDDIIYNNRWLEQLYASYMQNPNEIHCCRGHTVKFDNNMNILPYNKWPRDVRRTEPAYDILFTGCGGVLYPPSSLHNSVTNESLFTRICPHGDDLWFWGMAVLNDTKVKIVPNNNFKLNFIPESQDIALWRTNDVGGENDIMIDKLFKQFPEIKNKIISNCYKADKNFNHK